MLVLLLALAADTPPIPAPTPTPKPKMICAEEADIGSRLTRRVCRIDRPLSVEERQQIERAQRNLGLPPSKP